MTIELSAPAEKLNVEVFSPRDPNPKKFSWPTIWTVGEAADDAAKAFGYEAGTPTLQNKDHEVLRRKDTLLDAGVREGDQLELTDTGGGV
ncbi:MAG: hypothetical protein OXE96_05190 [Gemmatimonadetes bacterium]|nr:hypothetical protein [Gemmatimonadota bacterium]